MLARLQQAVRISNRFFRWVAGLIFALALLAYALLAAGMLRVELETDSMGLIDPYLALLLFFALLAMALYVVIWLLTFLLVCFYPPRQAENQ